MTFKEAFKLMKDGKMVKLPSWSGYWAWDPDKKTIMMYCNPNQSDNGKAVVDIRDTKRVEYTMNNILSDAWIEATEENTPILGGTCHVDFATAIRMSTMYGLPIREKDSSDPAFIVAHAVIPGGFGINIATDKDNHKIIPLREVESKEWEIYE